MLAALWVLLLSSASAPMRVAGAAESAVLAVGQDLASIRAYAAWSDAPVAGVMAYANLTHPLYGTKMATEYGSGVEWGAASLAAVDDDRAVLQLGLDIVGQAEAASDGRLDAEIDALAKWIAALGRHVYVRIGYEFDNPDNHYAPAVFVRAFRRIAAHLHGASPHAHTVWHAWGFGDAGLEAYWPGADYADWVAVSIFQQPYSTEHKLRHGYPLDGWERPLNVSAFAALHKKPLMIAESTPFGGIHGDGAEVWESWFSPVLEFVRTEDVRFWSYIDCDWEAFPMWVGQGWGDSRVQAHAVTASRWATDVIGSERFGGGAAPALLLGSKPAGPRHAGGTNFVQRSALGVLLVPALVGGLVAAARRHRPRYVESEPLLG